MDTDQINSELPLLSENRNLSLHCHQLTKVIGFLSCVKILGMPLTTRDCVTPIINYIVCHEKWIKGYCQQPHFAMMNDGVGIMIPARTKRGRKEQVFVPKQRGGIINNIFLCHFIKNVFEPSVKLFKNHIAMSYPGQILCSDWLPMWTRYYFPPTKFLLISNKESYYASKVFPFCLLPHFCSEGVAKNVL